jgi:AcrR family transcriptional regulator
VSTNKSNREIKKTRKERQRERHRNEIVVAAERLFLSQGYENTTMKEIAKSAEFAKGTLYNYFESKEDLYLSIGTNAYEILIQITSEFINKKEFGIEQLMAVGYAYYEFTKNHPGYASIFHDISIRIPELSKKKQKDYTKAEKEYFKQAGKYRDLFIEVIGNAVKNEKIRSDIDPMMIGISLSSLSSGLIKELEQSRAFLEKMKFGADDIIGFVFSMIAEGLKPRENKKNNKGEV